MSELMYVKPVLLSKKQVGLIRKGKLITIARGKKKLQIGMKGYSPEKAKVKAEILRLQTKMKAL